MIYKHVMFKAGKNKWRNGYLELNEETKEIILQQKGPQSGMFERGLFMIVFRIFQSTDSKRKLQEPIQNIVSIKNEKQGILKEDTLEFIFSNLEQPVYIRVGKREEELLQQIEMLK